MTKKGFLTAFSIMLTLIVSGCAEIEPPNPVNILQNPLGTDPITMGMTKEKVIKIWGSPNFVTRTGHNELGVVCEEWVYRAHYPLLPVNAGYLHKTKYLYFEGNVLVRQKEE
ncbi:MAG: hypothetical protein U9R31_01560 [Candidatus Omnitrophota bacterium]|nr:hypothetical protein [Candidatus Omnitrophota bacterium]